MPYLNPQDLETHLYPELMKEICRGNGGLIQTAINTAVQEAKLFLGRFDTLQLFGDDYTPPTVQDPYLQNLVKDLACWHLLRLSNVNTDLQLFRNAYQDALGTLKEILNGTLQPKGWPYAIDPEDRKDVNEGVSWNSNPKRHNYY
jgi:hypothetical protein